MKVPMTDALHDGLKTLKATAHSVYVFCQEDGRPFIRQALMRRVCKRAGVRTFSFHCIGHRRRAAAGARDLDGGAVASRAARICPCALTASWWWRPGHRCAGLVWGKSVGKRAGGTKTKRAYGETVSP
ncbi:hypothetical protein JCM14124_21620 [Humidesulfovibrio idahonensis]